MSYVEDYLAETREIAQLLDAQKIEVLAKELDTVRSRRGRVFCIGLGGGAANASHAANDLRKLCAIEAYCFTDNVAEFSARANDDGWAEIFPLQFATCDDALMVFSVGGGTETVSPGIAKAIRRAVDKKMRILGVVGNEGGAAYQLGNCVIMVPAIAPNRITPHTEGFQAVILHCLVSHPLLQRKPAKW